jgi:hypothetical protein
MIGQHKPSSGGESYTLPTSVSNLQTSTLMVAISGLEEGFGKAFPVTPVQLPAQRELAPALLGHSATQLCV